MKADLIESIMATIRLDDIIRETEDRDYIRKLLEKRIPDDTCEKPTQQELDDRDNDLANIFNISVKTDSKGDMYMKIIGYLVKKWFLQKWEDDTCEKPAECIHEYISSKYITNKCWINRTCNLCGRAEEVDDEPQQEHPEAPK